VGKGWQARAHQQTSWWAHFACPPHAARLTPWTASKALLITRDEATRAQSVAVADLGLADLMPGNVDVRV